MSAIENQVSEDFVYEAIVQHAKPTVTLAQLKTYTESMMEENELRMCLGRLWRSVRIFRCPVSNHVAYWTEESARAAAASGLQPEMPEGVDQPDCTLPPPGPKPKIDVAKIITGDFVASNREEKAMVNRALSRGQLIPISQTAALPMRPLAFGTLGNLRRNGVTAKVATAMFKYRDVRLSIDAVVLICKDLTRVDVARVLSQLSTYNEAKDYFKRFAGATRFDSTFQWNDRYSYPFSHRKENDGEDLDCRNADTETKDDDTLDHIPPNQLTENETESEIARLLREQAQTQEQTVDQTATEQVVIDGKLRIDDPAGIIRGDGVPAAFESKEGMQEQSPTQKLLDAEPHFTGELKVESVDKIPSRDDTMKSVSAPETENKVYRVDEKDFDASINLRQELTMNIDGTPIQLTQQATAALIDLLGPIYFAWKHK